MRRMYLISMVLIIMLISFYFGSFTLIISETNSSAQTATSRDANATFNEGFCVYPDSPFGNLVASELKARGHKVLTLSAPVECDGQFLAVWVEWVNVSYFPVFSKGQLKAVAIYSSAGDPSHYLRYRNSTDKRKALITFNETDGPQVQGYIIVRISDESKGIMSLRGYQDYLMRKAAEMVARQAELFRSKGGV